jgi:hypothetical protein
VVIGFLKGLKKQAGKKAKRAVTAALFIDLGSNPSAAGAGHVHVLANRCRKNDNAMLYLIIGYA